MDEEVLQKIKRIEERIENIEKRLNQIQVSPTKSALQSTSVKDVLSLSSSLQKTLLAIREMEEATSTEVSERTGRDRTVETIYLNQLTRLGYLTKKRRGHKYYFRVVRYY